jgi:hypothetical protein
MSVRYAVNLHHPDLLYVLPHDSIITRIIYLHLLEVLLDSTYKYSAHYNTCHSAKLMSRLCVASNIHNSCKHTSWQTKCSQHILHISTATLFITVLLTKLQGRMLLEPLFGFYKCKLENKRKLKKRVSTWFSKCVIATHVYTNLDVLSF